MANSATAGAPVAAPTVPPRLGHSFWWYLKWFFIVCQLLVFVAVFVSAAMLKRVYDQMPEVTPDLKLLMDRNRASGTRVFAADGSLLAEFKDEERKWTGIEDLKRDTSRGANPGGRLIDATLSIEDSRFYQHAGMDPKRIAGALVANFRHGGVEQGGSTITEQLAKLVFLNNSRTFSRRLNTAMLALQLERKLSKDEILEAYLNEIYYGNRAYGCEAAARRYFNKSARDLTIAEAALMAGLPQSPTRLDPFDHFDRAQKRQRIVLHEMLENNRINYGQWREAMADTTVASDLLKAQNRFDGERRKVERWRYPYFVSYVKSYVEKQYGYTEQFLNKAGLKIYTTIDPKLQDLAEQAVYRQVDRLGRPGLEGAMVCIDPWTGQIVAMVGGRNYYGKNGQWNRAVQGKRQVGSTMKPYIYAAAMEAGMTPDSVIVDSPLYVCGTGVCNDNSRDQDRHEVRNYDRRHHGAMTLRQALGFSNNVVATKLLLKVGIQNAIQKAHLMGVQSSLVPYPSLALGVSDLSLLEHVSAYGAFATKGLRAEATPVVRIDSSSGETLVEQPNPVRGARVLSAPAAESTWKMMRYVVTSGLGKAANIPGVNVIGKTGTTSSNKDVWFMGATDDLVAGVWMGYDRPRELYGSAGGRWCAPVWRSFMVGARDVWSKRNPVKRLIEDTRATAQQRLIADQYKKFVRVKICNESGLVATPQCPDTKWVTFSAAGGAPTLTCDIHRAHDDSPRDLADSVSDGTVSPGAQGADPAFDPNRDPGFQPGDNGASDEDQPKGKGRRRNSTTGATTGDQSGDNTAPPDTGSHSGNAGAVMDDPGNGGDFNPPAADGDAATPARRAASGSPNNRANREDREVVETVCAESGELATKNCPVKVQRTFVASEAPHRYCHLHP